MNAYQTEQLNALQMVRQHLCKLPDSEVDALKAEITDYLEFRSRMAVFLEKYFKDTCTEKCYHSRLSASCS